MVGRAHNGLLLTGGVEELHAAQGIFMHIGLKRFHFPVKGDRHKYHRGRVCSRLSSLELRRFLPAVRAPGGPEMQHNLLAAEIGQGNRTAVYIL